MGAQAQLLSEGERLHLQHGPIDLIIGAEGDRTRAFEAAFARFESVLDELARELPLLQTALGARLGPCQGPDRAEDAERLPGHGLPGVSSRPWLPWPVR